MKDVARLFDYFKDAFHLNVENRKLYMPQIILILVKTCIFLAFGIFIYQVIVSFEYTGFSENVIKDAVFGLAWWIAGMILLGIIGGIVIEAGLFNMYRVCIYERELRSGEFFEGVRKNFLKFLLADFIMLIVWLLIFIPYIIIGVLSLLTGFVLIPLMISVFTIMWKVSMAVDDVFVIEGFKRGFHFAVEHFIPLSVLVIIRESFLNLGNGSWKSNSRSSSSNSSSNFMDDLPIDIEPPDITVHQGYLKALPYIKIGFYVMLPVISIAVIVGSLVRMVFQIFFGLASFIMYADNVSKPDERSSWEVE
ncbi:hypothetical protein SAMN02745751_00186 [Dethiosulfatibacter aminovorans DSM 17477]|uniref:Uncharacterized protein n=1 Tax=Dethiosulfatibacter aminovorans DSM 17477 TaxID=1121476 RepID=A0A1M6AN78_9FIRM|nr:hypothetical protein [Dethiosulfatibacter aminovorans]SHI37936.1 hypothetical protein SAMN02745751_00186 [Dethiosulfatibacter aminovorans DSM 17477]